MTCIVGIAHPGGVTIGGDSAGVAGHDLTLRKDSKVFALEGGRVVFGFTSSFRMGDLLRYGLDLPNRDRSGDLDRWMRTAFIDAVRGCLKAGGYATVNNGVETGGVFLVGIEGRLFRVESDFQVGESAHGVDAVGCGASFALGALLALGGAAIGMGDHAALAEHRARQALRIAETCSAGVRGPFRVCHAQVLRPTPPEDQRAS
jgi:ATP-dependent protease HslVU (ClpYQ) peptidase subunit